MLKILLVNLSSVPKQDGKFVQQLQSMPMGILYLSAYIKKYTNYEVRMLDVGEETDWEPDIIGYSVVFSSSHEHFVEVSQDLKKQFPKALHIAGGNHATNAFEEVGRHVDHVFLGEGELSLVECLNNGFPSKYIKSELMDITEILQPDWELLDIDKYIHGKTRAMDTDKKTATIITSRGCPFKCTFCAGFTVHGRKLRQRSIDSVIAEVKELNERYGVNLFIIEDDLFLAPKSRGLELLKRFRELNIPDFELKLPSALAVKILDEELIDALIQAGARVINLAIESGSERIQESIKKRVPLQKAKRLVKYIREQEIDGEPILARCYFMLGFPGETKEDMQKTIEYAISIKADWCRFAAATPLIGSEMFDSFRPLLPENIYNATHFSIRMFDTPEISAKELTTIVRDMHNHVNYLNNPYFSESKFDKGLASLLEYSRKYPDKTAQVTFSCDDGELRYRVGTKDRND